MENKKISNEEVVDKLLAIFSTKRRIAEELNVTPQAITNLHKCYNKITEEHATMIEKLTNFKIRKDEIDFK